MFYNNVAVIDSWGKKYQVIFFKILGIFADLLSGGWSDKRNRSVNLIWVRLHHQPGIM